MHSSYTKTKHKPIILYVYRVIFLIVVCFYQSIIINLHFPYIIHSALALGSYYSLIMDILENIVYIGFGAQFCHKKNIIIVYCSKSFSFFVHIKKQPSRSCFFLVKKSFSLLLWKASLVVQSKSFIWVCRNISALFGCIKKLRAFYEVQLLEFYKIPQLNLI